MNHLNFSFRRKNVLIKTTVNTIQRLISYETIQNLKQEQKSALFLVPNAKKTKISIFPFLFRPDFNNLNDLFENLDSFNHNLASRQISIDINKLKLDYLRVKSLESDIEKLKLEKDDLAKRVSDIVTRLNLHKKDMMSNSEVKALIIEAKIVKTKIDSIKNELSPLQECFYIDALRLPNNLHPNTPTKGNTVLFEYKNRPNTSKITFKSNTNWSFRSNNDDNFMRYSCGDYAKLEFVLNEYFSRKLREYNTFEYIKSASLLKSALVEGCGEDFNDSSRFLNILRWSSEGGQKGPTEVDLLHFTGTSSLYSLILNFAKTKINEVSLPWISYTNGKNHSPTHGQVPQFDLLAICSKNNNSLENNIKNELIKNDVDTKSLFQESDSENTFFHLVLLLSSLYRELNVHYRLVAVAANSLKLSECSKILLEIFVPSENKFKTAAEITFYDDYISRRLQILTTSQNKLTKCYPSMIHAKLVDINILMQSIIDSNNQQDGENLVLSDSLKKLYEEMFF